MLKSAASVGLVLAVMSAPYLCGAGAVPGRPEKLSFSELSLEVAALETLYSIQLTREQLTTLQAVAQKIQQPASRREGKASVALRDALSELRQALIEATDDKRIEQLEDQIDRLRKSERPSLDDEVEFSEEAIGETPRVLRLLSASQVAAFAGSLADDIADPLDTLLDAIEQVRDMDEKKWQDFRTITAEEVAMLLGGLDGVQSAAYREKVIQLLIVVRGLGTDEFKSQRAELEKKARMIVGDAGPLEVIRHYVENRIAELLSNPRLSAAVAARLRAGEKD